MCNITEAMLREVCEQRDRAHNAIARLIDAFWNAHYNHAFDAEDQYEDTKEKGADGKPKPYMCSAGRSLRDCFKGCDLFDKEGICKGRDCPMGFYHRELYSEAQSADALLKAPPAELREFDLRRIPKWNRDCEYKVSVGWLAKMLLSYFVAFRLDKAYSNEEWGKWTEAFTALLRIGLSHYGIKLPDDLSGLACEDVNAMSEGATAVYAEMEKWADSHKELVERITEYERGNPEEFGVALAKDTELAMFYLVRWCVIFMGDFAFGKDYPSCDLGIYADAIAAFKYRCVDILGLPHNGFDVVMCLNNLDDRGLEIKRKEGVGQ